jgi:hypothetical protein
MSTFFSAAPGSVTCSATLAASSSHVNLGVSGIDQEDL